MANPFHYAKTKHKRTRVPPQFRRYSQFKDDLRLEFQGQCVYCRALDHVKGYESFGVDHYRPKTHFPNLEVEYMNLFYACNRCNALKGAFWPGVIEQALNAFIPNPCEHVMFEHLRYMRGQVDAASSAGVFTIDRLDLNEPRAVEFRNGFIAMLAKLSSEEQVAAALMEDATKRIQAATTSEAKEDAEEILQIATGNWARTREVLRLALGELVFQKLQA